MKDIYTAKFIKKVGVLYSEKYLKTLKNKSILTNFNGDYYKRTWSRGDYKPFQKALLAKRRIESGNTHYTYDVYEIILPVWKSDFAKYKIAQTWFGNDSFIIEKTSRRDALK